MKNPKSVSFRLDTESKFQIEERAVLAGVSVGGMVRKFVLEALKEETKISLGR